MAHLSPLILLNCFRAHICSAVWGWGQAELGRVATCVGSIISTWWCAQVGSVILTWLWRTHLGTQVADLARPLPGCGLRHTSSAQGPSVKGLQPCSLQGGGPSPLPVALGLSPGAYSPRLQPPGTAVLLGALICLTPTLLPGSPWTASPAPAGQALSFTLSRAQAVVGTP